MGPWDKLASLVPRLDVKYAAVPGSGAGAVDPTVSPVERNPEKTYPIDFKRAVLRYTMGGAIAVLLGYLVVSAFA
jgi:hypothetical protein